MMFPGVQQLVGSPELRERCNAVALPEVASHSIGLLQTFFAIALFCAGLSIVLALFRVKRAARSRGRDGAVQAFIIGVTALFGLVITKAQHCREGR